MGFEWASKKDQRVNALPLTSERSNNLAVRPALRNHHPPSVAERRCGFGGFRFGVWCRLNLLDNDGVLIVESIPIKKSKAVKRM
jgi:hypothetical protein